MSISGNLTVVIQAGGESRRMGRSKATVPFLGRPLIWRGIDRMLPIADELIITTNEPEKLDFLDELVTAGKIRLVRDVVEQRGALQGIYTAMSAATKDFVALIACDMLFPSPDLITAELAALIESGRDAAVPTTKLGYEPFHGVYWRATCLPVVRKAVEAGEAKAGSWFEKVRLCEFDDDMVAAADPQGRCFVNANTPEELLRAERMLQSEGDEGDAFQAAD